MPMRIGIAFVIVVGLAAAAAAQPAPPTPDQCGPVIAESVKHTQAWQTSVDEAARTGKPAPAADATVKWTQSQVEAVWPLTKLYKAKDLSEQAAAAHDQAAKEIATNERHVVLAYAAMWILSAVFLVVLWRRQHGLKAQIADLKKDLEAAVKDAG